MARSQSFDRAEVLRAARTLFWQVGYDAAAIPDLEKATGIKRSSLYNTFGSKRMLFDAALTSYLNDIIRPRLQPLKEDTVEKDALAQYLRGLLDSVPQAPGCLLINTAASPLAHDDEIAGVIAGYRRELMHAIGRGLVAAGADPGLKEAITGQVIAAFAIARIDSDAAQASIKAALELLP